MSRYGDSSYRAGIYDALDACALHRIQQTSRAFDIAVVKLLGVPRPQPVIRRHVKHPPRTLHRTIERSRIPQIPFHRFDGQAFQNRQITRASNQHANSIAGSDKLPCDVATHESRRAGHERSHKVWQTGIDAAIFSLRIREVRLRATGIAALGDALKMLALRKPQRRFATSKARIA